MGKVFDILKEIFSGKVILAGFIIAIGFLSAYPQNSVNNEDSLYKAKTSNLKGYTNINVLVAEEGYKFRIMDVPDDKLSILPGVEGPMEPTILPLRKATSWKQYSYGSSSRLVIFLTDTLSNWLGIVSGLKAQGTLTRHATALENQAQATRLSR